MSIKAIDKVWSASHQSGVYLLALIALADYAHDNGTNAFPKMKTLRKKLRYKTDRAVQKILSALIESGELVRHDQKGPNGVNLFDIIYQDGSNWDLIKGRCKKYDTPLKGEQMDGVNKRTPPPVQMDTPPTGEQMDTHNHEPSIEPNINNNSPESDSPEFPPPDPAFAKVSQLYKQEINLMFGSTTADLLKDLADTYPLDWIEKAFKIAVKANARRLDYVEGILKRWQEKGHPTLEKQKRKTKEPDTERIDESQYVEVVPEEESHDLAVDKAWLDEQFKKFRGGQNGNS